MGTYSEANQARLSLKMILSNYYWFNGAHLSPDGDDWSIIVNIVHIDNSIRKIIPIVHKGFNVKVEVEQKKK